MLWVPESLPACAGLCQPVPGTPRIRLGRLWWEQKVIRPVGPCAPLVAPCGGLKERAGTPIERIADIDAWRPEGQKVIPPVGTLRNVLEEVGGFRTEGYRAGEDLKRRAGASIKKNC